MKYLSKFAVLSFLLLSILISSSHAQVNGSIVGYIFDGKTQEALPGANVHLKGTSIGAATDLEGKYIINQVSPGEYQLVITYIGYHEKILDISLAEGQKLEENIALDYQSLEGETIVVTAQAEGQLKAINEQLSASTIKNVVSAERIQELPDESAAAALSRLPGLSLQDGDKVVIRGLQAKMNTVLVNGVALPSTDMNDRSTNLGFISSNMLDGIEVIKTLTPDMDANSIGGVVNLKIKQAPSGLNFDVLTQGMFNVQDRTTDNYKFWASASNRFLDDKLGVFIQGNADRNNGGLDQSSAGYVILNRNLDYGHSPYTMDNFSFIDEVNIITNYGGSVILDYKLPAGKIILQNTLAHTLNDNTRNRVDMLFVTNDARYTLNRDKHNKELLINALQAEYDFGPVKMEMGLAHSFSDKNTDTRYGDPGNSFGFANVLNDAHFLTPAGDTLTSDDFQDDDRLKLKPQDVYDMVIPDYDWKDAAMAEWCVTRSEEFKQHLYNINLDFTVPASFLNYVSGNFKLGGKFTRSTRTNDANETYHRVGDSDFYLSVSDFIPGKTLKGGSTDPNEQLTVGDIKNYDYDKDRGKYYLNGDYDFIYALDTDKLDKFMVDVQKGWNHIPTHLARSERDDFNGTEIFSAGYLMGNFNVGPKLSVLGGLRYEHYNMDYKANFLYVTHNVDGDRANFDTLNTVDRNDDDFFPNAQLRYKYTPWGDVRMAYSKSIIRPDYQAIIPNTYYVPGTGSVNGNTLLKPTISDNYDINFSFYNNKIGLFTIGGFYKKMQDVFFQTNIYFQNLNLYNVSFPDSNTWKKLGFDDRDQWPARADVITTYLNNPNPAYVKGLEVEWQTHFWYLPRPFNALVLNVNYARVWSEMEYQLIENSQESYTYIDEFGRIRIGTRYLTTDTIRTARLLNQGNHILNVALGIDYKDFSGRLSFNLQGDVVSQIGARPEEDRYTGNLYKWDITLQQKLPIPGLSVALNGVNIFHNVRKVYQKFPNRIGGSIKENLFQTSYAPSIFDLNIRYSF